MDDEESERRRKLKAGREKVRVLSVLTIYVYMYCSH